MSTPKATQEKKNSLQTPKKEKHLPEKFRLVEKKVKNRWVKTELNNLQIGDVFRLFDPPDHTPVLAPFASKLILPGELIGPNNVKRGTNFRAISKAYVNKQGVWEVDAVIANPGVKKF